MIRFSASSAALIFCCLLFTGCPYSSKFPLTQTELPVEDTRLGGIWNTQSENAIALRVEFRPYNAQQYHLQVLKPGPTYQANTFSYLCSVIEAENRRFIQLRSLVDGTNDDWYYFELLSLGKKELRVKEMLPDALEGFPKFRNAEEFNAAFLQLVRSGKGFGEIQTWVKEKI